MRPSRSRPSGRSTSQPVYSATISVGVVCLFVLCGCPASKSPPPPAPPPPQQPRAERPPPPTEPSPQQSTSESDEQRAADERSEGEAPPAQDEASAPSTPPDGAAGMPQDTKEEPPGSAGTGAADGDGGQKEHGASAGEEGASEEAARTTDRGSGKDGSTDRAAGKPPPRAGSPGPWSEAGQEKVDELRKRMAVVDGILDEENAENEVRQQDASTPGGRTLREQAMEGTEGSRPHGSSDEEAANRRASAQDPYGEDTEDHSSDPGGAAGPQARPGAPPDVGDGSDDDVVAQQLRELAESETDPALREAYWCDYRKYKGLVTECPRPDPEQ